MQGSNSNTDWTIKDGDYNRKANNEVSFQDIKRKESKKKKFFYTSLVVLAIILEVIILNFVSKM